MAQTHSQMLAIISPTSKTDHWWTVKNFKSYSPQRHREHRGLFC